MTPFTRRTLRTWAVGCALHGLVVVATGALLVPWKTPAANVAAIAWGLLLLGAAPLLFRGSRLGFHLGVAAGALGLLGAAVVVGGLLASWAFLRGSYGEFGAGASIGAVLLAAVAFLVLGLVPALLLRALLRIEVREDLGVATRLPGPWTLLLPLLALPAALAFSEAVDLDPLPPLSAEARAQALDVLRAARSGARRPAAPALAGVPVAGPVWATAWKGGRPVARVAGEGRDLAEAVAAAADALAKRRKTLAGTRLALHRTVAVGRVPETPLLLSLAVDPGLDGLRREGAPPERTLLPEDLLRLQLFGAAPILKQLPELRVGLAAGPVLKRLAGDGRLERVRTEGVVEHGDLALPLSRGSTTGPPPSAEAFRAAAIEGGAFLLRQQKPDGSFHYRYLPLDDRHTTAKDYSLPRHAGAAYALAQLAGATGEARFAEGAAAAIAWLEREATRTPCGAEGRSCVGKTRWASLGPTALSLVAVLEYERQTKDARFRPYGERLLAFVRSLELPSGELLHRADPATGAPDLAFRTMFASEQAALAYVLAAQLWGDPADLAAAGRALDWLTGPKYDFFLGRFIYGADHWTCLAARDAFPILPERRYLDFCLGYVRFLERLQYGPSWDPDYVGHYGFSSVLVPQAPGTAGFSEAVVATVELAALHGERAEDVEAQGRLALSALLRDQLRDENALLVESPAAARGGVRRSLVEQEVRLDFTQHALSALLDGAEVLPGG